MNEGARQANAESERITAHTFADNQANRERSMLDKLDRIIGLLERIEANTRRTVSMPYVQVIEPCTCGQTPVCRQHSPTLSTTTTVGRFP